MKIKEVIEIIKVAKSEVEWNYPLDYQIAFDEAIKLLEKQMRDEQILIENCLGLDFECDYCIGFRDGYNTALEQLAVGKERE